MKTYLIIYQLMLPESSYPQLFAFLRSGQLWARPLPNAWMIKYNFDAGILRNNLMQYVYKGDRIFVTAIPNGEWGTFNIESAVTDWMKINLS